MSDVRNILKQWVLGSKRTNREKAMVYYFSIGDEK